MSTTLIAQQVRAFAQVPALRPAGATFASGAEAAA
jgi:hypothetical protein